VEVWVESSVTVDAPPVIDTVVTEVTVETAEQVVGDGDRELVLLLEVLEVDELDVAVAKQEQALEIRDGR
jgi:hypothetical protein